jgi:hypothetical protein
VAKGTRGARRVRYRVTYPVRKGAILIQVGERRFLSTGKHGQAIAPLVRKINVTLKKLGVGPLKGTFTSQALREQYEKTRRGR